MNEIFSPGYVLGCVVGSVSSGLFYLYLGFRTKRKKAEPEPELSEVAKRARAHNENPGDLPPMCEVDGAYKRRLTLEERQHFFSAYGGNLNSWTCDVCVERQKRRAVEIKKEVEEHNARIRQATLETEQS